MKVKEPITFYSVGAVISPHDYFADYQSMHYYFLSISLYIIIILECTFFYELHILTDRVLKPTGNVTQSASMIINRLTLSESVTT